MMSDPRDVLVKNAYKDALDDVSGLIDRARDEAAKLKMHPLRQELTLGIFDAIRGGVKTMRENVDAPAASAE